MRREERVGDKQIEADETNAGVFLVAQGVTCYGIVNQELRS